MGNQTLSFIQEGREHKARFVSTGTSVVQVHRDYEPNDIFGSLGVYAYLEGMPPVRIHYWTKYTGSNDMIFQVDVPAGVNVEIVSDYPVSSCNILTEE